MISKLVMLFVAWWVLAVGGSMITRQMPHGEPEQITDQHCAAGHFLIEEKGFPCTATRQAYGQPFVVQYRYTKVEPLNRIEVVPLREYYEPQNVFRFSISRNGALIASLLVGAAFFVLYRRERMLTAALTESRTTE